MHIDSKVKVFFSKEKKSPNRKLLNSDLFMYNCTSSGTLPNTAIEREEIKEIEIDYNPSHGQIKKNTRFMGQEKTMIPKKKSTQEKDEREKATIILEAQTYTNTNDKNSKPSSSFAYSSNKLLGIFLYCCFLLLGILFSIPSYSYLNLNLSLLDSINNSSLPLNLCWKNVTLSLLKSSCLSSSPSISTILRQSNINISSHIENFSINFQFKSSDYYDEIKHHYHREEKKLDNINLITAKETLLVTPDSVSSFESDNSNIDINMEFVEVEHSKIIDIGYSDKLHTFPINEELSFCRIYSPVSFCTCNSAEGGKLYRNNFSPKTENCIFNRILVDNNKGIKEQKAGSGQTREFNNNSGQDNFLERKNIEESRKTKEKKQKNQGTKEENYWASFSPFSVENVLSPKCHACSIPFEVTKLSNLSCSSFPNGDNDDLFNDDKDLSVSSVSLSSEDIRKKHSKDSSNKEEATTKEGEEIKQGKLRIEQEVVVTNGKRTFSKKISSWINRKQFQLKQFLKSFKRKIRFSWKVRGRQSSSTLQHEKKDIQIQMSSTRVHRNSTMSIISPDEDATVHDETLIVGPGNIEIDKINASRGSSSMVNSIDEEWIVSEESDSIKTSYRYVPGTSQVVVHGEALFDIHIGSIMNVFLNTSKSIEWVNFLQEVIEYRANSTHQNHHVIYQFFNMPWPLSNREFLLERLVDINHHDRSVYAHYRSIEHPFHPDSEKKDISCAKSQQKEKTTKKNKAVRGETIATSWFFQPYHKDNSKTYVNVKAILDPKLELKGWVANFVQNSLQRQSLKLFRDVCQKTEIHPDFANWTSS